MDNTIFFAEMLSGYPDLIKVSDLQEILGISRRYAYDLLKERRILSFRIANAYCIPKVFILDYFQELQKKAEDERRELAGMEGTDSTTKIP